MLAPGFFTASRHTFKTSPSHCFSSLMAVAQGAQSPDGVGHVLGREAPQANHREVTKPLEEVLVEAPKGKGAVSNLASPHQPEVVGGPKAIIAPPMFGLWFDLAAQTLREGVCEPVPDCGKSDGIARASRKTHSNPL